MLPISPIDKPPTYSQRKLIIEPMPSSTEEAISIEVKPKVLKQGDSFFVKVISSSTPANLRGNFLGKDLLFTSMDNGNSQLAIFGIDAKEEPGEYKLYLHHGGNDDEYYIKIVSGEFPVTKLVVTEELKDRGYTPSQIVQSIGQDENVKLRQAMKSITASAYFTSPFIKPLDSLNVEGYFGNIRREGSSAFQHLGTDLEAKVGTPVYAVNKGKVVFREDLKTYGKTLVIDHGLGIYSLYLHLSSFRFDVGDIVEKGAIVALSGNSGYSIDPHLHMSIKINGASVDPLKFIRLSEDW